MDSKYIYPITYLQQGGTIGPPTNSFYASKMMSDITKKLMELKIKIIMKPTMYTYMLNKKNLKFAYDSDFIIEPNGIYYMNSHVIEFWPEVNYKKNRHIFILVFKKVLNDIINDIPKPIRLLTY
jgi:hypothetical protein